MTTNEKKRPLEYDELDQIPGVSDRVRAAVTDSFVLVALSVIASQIFTSIGEEIPIARGITIVLIFALYDPLMVSILGGTIGHRIMGLRVKSQVDVSKNINIVAAIIRYFVKLVLGGISLFVVSKKEKRHAIHDMVAKSVVVYAKESET